MNVMCHASFSSLSSIIFRSVVHVTCGAHGVGDGGLVKVGLNVGPYTRIQGGIEGCTYPITLRSSDSERKRHREQLWRLYQKGSVI